MEQQQQQLDERLGKLQPPQQNTQTGLVDACAGGKSGGGEVANPQLDERLGKLQLHDQHQNTQTGLVDACAGGKSGDVMTHMDLSANRSGQISQDRNQNNLNKCYATSPQDYSQECMQLMISEQLRLDAKYSSLAMVFLLMSAGILMYLVDKVVGLIRRWWQQRKNVKDRAALGNRMALGNRRDNEVPTLGQSKKALEEEAAYTDSTNNDRISRNIRQLFSRYADYNRALEQHWTATRNGATTPPDKVDASSLLPENDDY